MEFKDSLTYVDLNDPNTMARKIIKLLENPESLNYQIQKGYHILKIESLKIS